MYTNCMGQEKGREKSRGFKAAKVEGVNSCKRDFLKFVGKLGAIAVGGAAVGGGAFMGLDKLLSPSE